MVKNAEFQNVNVLIVDDQDPMRKALVRIVRSMGVENTFEAVDVSDSLKILQSNEIHFVLCDLYLRTKQGFKILEFIRGRDVFNDIPVIMISGEDARDRIVKMVSEGASDFIVKPFQTAEIEKKVLKHLASYLKPSPLAKLLQQGDRFFVAGNTVEALNAYNKALETDPKSPRVTLSVALALFKMKQTEAAKTKIEEGILAAPEYYKFFRVMADQFIQLGDFETAIQWLKKELAINPKQQMRQTLIANLLLNQSRPEEALEHLKVALQEEPTYYKALMASAKAFSMMHNFDKAVYYFQRARRADPKNAEPLLSAMEIFYRSEQPQRAEFLLRDEKKSHPARLDTYLLLAQHLTREKRFAEAELNLKELLAKDPTHEAAEKLLNKIRQGKISKTA